MAGIDKPGFLQSIALKSEAPQSYTVGGWQSLLMKYGSLWVTTATPVAGDFSVHARLITGIIGDGTAKATSVKILDPDGERSYNELPRCGAIAFRLTPS